MNATQWKSVFFVKVKNINKERVRTQPICIPSVFPEWWNIALLPGAPVLSCWFSLPTGSSPSSSRSIFFKKNAEFFLQKYPVCNPALQQHLSVDVWLQSRLRCCVETLGEESYHFFILLESCQTALVKSTQALKGANNFWMCLSYWHGPGWGCSVINGMSVCGAPPPLSLSTSGHLSVNA